MNPKVELVLTCIVCAAGLAYFGWRAFHAEGNGQLIYIAFIIVTLIYTHRSITDVRKKLQPSDDTDAN